MPATPDEKAAIPKMEVRLAEISTSLTFIKWIGVFMAGCAVGVLGFSYSAVQRVTRIEDAVVALQKDFAEVKTDLKEMRKDTADLRADFKSQAGQLDRIEKALAQNPPARPKPTP